MMTKVQKIWLWIFVAMFAIPEILWSPILTLFLPLFLGGGYKFRDSFLFSGDISPFVSTVVISIQFLAILSASILLYRNRNKSIYKLFVFIFLFLVSIVTFIALYFQIAISGSSLIL